MDLTVLAIPYYFGSMAAERRWLEARSDDPELAAAQYERRDTIANLTMGTTSLILPLVAQRARRHLELGRGRYAKPAAVTALAAASVAAVADGVRRYLDRTDPKEAPADERGLRRAARRRLARRRAAQVGGASAAAAVAVGGTVLAATWGSKLTPQRLWEHRRIDLGEGWLPFALAIVGWDLIYYWNHRFMHEARYMWAIHVVHHSSEHYNLSVALRQPVADVLGTFVPYGLLCLAGIRPAYVHTARSLNLLYQYWVHTEAIRHLGRAEEVLNSPSAHRVHHGTNPQYIDRNHGGILITWDRLFGTYEPEGEKVVYGLTKNLGSFSPLRIAFHEYLDILRDVARSETWRDRLSFVVRGPGWAYERHRQLGWSRTAAAAPAAAA
jgi:sterol desaturase/sphingolipid hydroxylase (fatty acid hydroxylase superfamily)